MGSVYDYKVLDGQGDEVSLETYRGSVLLIVNVASKCGLTPQYKQLEELYQEFGPQGLVVLGFPCNQFAGQEPGSIEEITSFCQLNYGVSFPLFSKVKVNGGESDPLFAYLKSELPGALGIQAIKWNFTKFLTDRRGRPVTRFAPQTSPLSLRDEIQKYLGDQES